MKRSILQTGLMMFAAAIVAAVLVLVGTPLDAQSDVPVFINEIHYDNTEGDVDEAIEVAGPAGTDLAGWSIVLYNGSNGAEYDTQVLLGVISDQQNSFGALTFAYPTNAIQNGSPDGVALVNPANEVVHFLSYEGSFTAAGGPADGMTSTDIGVSELNSTASGQSLQLVGVGTLLRDFAWSGPAATSQGRVNNGQTFATGSNAGGKCGDLATLIHDIQGTHDTFDPMFGGLQSIEGVVVGDFPGLRGFYVQEEDGDADDDPATSEGIFVFMGDDYGTPPVETGAKVRVRGVVDEYVTASGSSFQTQIGNPSILDCGPSSVEITPAEIMLPVGSLDDFERYEGMLVRFPQELTIAEYFDYDRHGELVLALPQMGEGRPYQGTAVAEPGAESQSIANQNVLRRITLDDGRTTQNPDPAMHPNGTILDLTNRFRGGDTVTGVTGVVDNNFGHYRIQPTAKPVYTQNNPRPAQPAGVGGTLKVASLNVLNFFTTLDSGPAICGPDQNLDCRGANTAEEFSRQRDKILAALEGLDADIVGLLELENNPSDSLQSLIDGLNERLGPGTYNFIDTGTLGSDAIKVGLLYKPGTVTPSGSHAVLDATSFTDPNNVGQQKNRPTLAQTFAENASGETFTVAVNHLKSKGSGCGGGDDDALQGNCNGTRTQAAERLVDWLATDPTGGGDTDFLIIGDLNAYDKEDPIDAIRNGADNIQGSEDDFTDLIADIQGELAYSYVYDGQFGYLDHALANQSLRQQVTSVTEWHINADEPDIFDYDTSFKKDAQDALYEANPYRASDHDPILVGLALGPHAVLASSHFATEEGMPAMVEQPAADVLIAKLQSIEAEIQQLRQEVEQIKEMLMAMNE